MSTDSPWRQKFTEKSIRLVFWEKSHPPILSPTSERDILVLVQRAIQCFQTGVEDLFEQHAER